MRGRQERGWDWNHMEACERKRRPHPPHTHPFFHLFNNCNNYYIYILYMYTLQNWHPPRFAGQRFLVGFSFSIGQVFRASWRLEFIRKLEHNTWAVYYIYIYGRHLKKIDQFDNSSISSQLILNTISSVNIWTQDWKFSSNLSFYKIGSYF